MTPDDTILGALAFMAFILASALWLVAMLMKKRE
jgi:hypothetical protein